MGGLPTVVEEAAVKEENVTSIGFFQIHAV
ncbi:unnamed protein product [Victoria cruziana]